MARYVVLDIGGTFVKCATMDESASFIDRSKVPSVRSSLDGFLSCLDACIAPRLIGAEGIAVSMPGRVDTDRGVAISGGAFSFIDSLPIAQKLQERYGIPVTVANDAKCATAAELWDGALSDVNSGLVYVLGTGIGGGIAMDGHVVMGSHFAAGELSFCVGDASRPYGVNNLIAAKLGTKGLLRTYEEASGEKVDGIELFRRIDAGEREAATVFDEFCDLTAKFLFDLQAILDVDRIAIGGGISAQPILISELDARLKGLYETLTEQLGTIACQAPEVVRCRYGNDANLIGALGIHLRKMEAQG
ncbi:MAG: ROK family protein [Tractidigestivibacter sp.]|jgi:predicted NBD/HSP70 family sugar kinase|uniref:ROK family protein n=1 Tax=Tractidigestivibacter sp. TaxID=2847320 RepID=UPI003D8CBFA3